MKKIKLLILIIVLPAISGCSLGGNTGATNDGGVYKTINKAQAWQRKNAIPTTSGKPGSIAQLNINTLAMDPSDSNAIYYGSLDNGLFYTYDGGNNWQFASGLGKATIKAVAIDPKDKCTIYATIGNKIYQSTDCNRTWSQVYYDNNTTIGINSLAIDHYNTSIVYSGNSRGDLMVSNDRGQSWQIVSRFKSSVRRILISQTDSRLIFIATLSSGLFRTTDKGLTWLSLANNLKAFPGANSFKDLAITKNEPGLMILANNYGLLRTINNGDDWTNIKLLTPEKNASINSVAINQMNSKEIYYVTGTTFYSTGDGGDTWTTKKLPTTRQGGLLMTDPNQDGVIYLTTIVQKKKSTFGF